MSESIKRIGLMSLRNLFDLTNNSAGVKTVNSELGSMSEEHTELEKFFTTIMNGVSGDIRGLQTFVQSSNAVRDHKSNAVKFMMEYAKAGRTLAPWNSNFQKILDSSINPNGENTVDKSISDPVYVTTMAVVNAGTESAAYLAVKYSCECDSGLALMNVIPNSESLKSMNPTPSQTQSFDLEGERAVLEHEFTNLNPNDPAGLLIFGGKAVEFTFRCVFADAVNSLTQSRLPNPSELATELNAPLTQQNIRAASCHANDFIRKNCFLNGDMAAPVIDKISALLNPVCDNPCLNKITEDVKSCLGKIKSGIRDSSCKDDELCMPPCNSSKSCESEKCEGQDRELRNKYRVAHARSSAKESMKGCVPTKGFAPTKPDAPVKCDSPKRHYSLKAPNSTNSEITETINKYQRFLS
jgi:hypothetical protein